MTMVIFMNDPLSGLMIDEPRWGPILALPADGSFASGVDYIASPSQGFGADIIGTIRMHVTPEPLTAIETLSDDNTVNVFPNPANQNVTMELGLVNTTNDAVIRIIDLTGKTLFTQQYDNLQNDILSFNVSQYAAGTYFLQLITEEGSRTNKFTVQH